MLSLSRNGARRPGKHKKELKLQAGENANGFKFSNYK